MEQHAKSADDAPSPGSPPSDYDAAEATLGNLLQERAGSCQRLLDEVTDSFRLGPAERTRLEARFASELHGERIRTRLRHERATRFTTLVARTARVASTVAITALALVSILFAVSWAIDSREPRAQDYSPGR